MKRWIREVWPSTGWFVFAAIIYLAMLLLPHLVYYSNGGTERYLDAWKFGIAPLGFYSFLYGAWRVVWFHPVYQPEYLGWLRQTPWSHEKPLPGGPIHLVPQDGVFVGLLTALACLHQVEYAFAIPVSFLISYIVFWEISFLTTKHFKHAYLMAFVLSGAIPFWNSPLGLSIVLALLLLVGAHGIRMTLHNFDAWSGRSEQVTSLWNNSKGKCDKLLGWPYDRLAPTLSDDEPSYSWSAALSFLLSWWSFLVVAVIVPHELGAVAVACVFAGLVMIVRYAKYLAGYSPPLSLRGRFLTGRWILPGFDIVYLAPLLILLLSGSVFLCAVLWNLPYCVAVAIISGGSLLIALQCPPDLNEWKLTGGHQIVPGVMLNASEFQQTQ